MDFYSLLLTARRYRHLLWYVTGIASIVLGVGAFQIRVETGILDWLPAHHPNVQAFGVLFEKLEATVNQELVWLEIDPQKAERLGVQSITDPKSFLAQEELVNFVRERVPRVRGEFGLLSLLRVATTLGQGTKDSPIAFPTPERIALLWSVVSGSSPDLVRALSSSDPTTPGTVIAFLIDAPPLSEEGRQVAQDVTTALDDYRGSSDLRYDLFKDRYLVPTGLSSGTSIMDRSLRSDLLWLVPAAAVTLIVMLRLAFGVWRPLFLILAQLSVGAVWTLGFMGWFGTPLNVITFALIPLILGCGIDYAIIVSLDALDRRGAGRSPEETIRELKKSSATAILLTTLTTSAGLLTLMLSDSRGMAALGLHGALGMLSLAFLSTLILPGILVGLPPGRSSRFGPVIAPIATSFARNRSVVLLVAGVATVAALVLVGKRDPLLDVVEGNYPAQSPMAQSVARMREKCGGSFPEIVIATGDLASPGAIDEIIDVERAIAASEVLGSRFRSVGLPDILGTYVLLQNRNVLEAGKALLETGGDVIGLVPRDPDTLRQIVGEMYDNPTWKSIVRLFVDPQLSVSTVLLLGGDAGTDMKSVEETWKELEKVVSGSTNVLEKSFLGYRTMAYLFATYSEQWIQRTLLVSLSVVLLLSILFLRQMRAVLVIFTLIVVCSLWWLALLHLADIYVSIFLLFPLVFAICIGSDYALHMLCRLRADRQLLQSDSDDVSPLQWTRSAWSSTGRAIAISASTDAIIFLIFTNMELVSASQVMMAVTLAVLAVFGGTILILPALAFSKDELREPRGRH